jgi:hypothetical protein
MSESVFGFEALHQRLKANLSRTAVGAPEMELAGCEPASYEGGRDVFAQAVALKHHRFHFGATRRAPSHHRFAPVYDQQAFGLDCDPCRFRHHCALRSTHRYRGCFVWSASWTKPAGKVFNALFNISQ